MTKKKNYRVGVFPKNRDIIVDAASMAKYYNHVYGILDVDVTKAVEKMERYFAETGVKLSLTAWVMRCLAVAATEFVQIRTFRYRKRKTIIFDDVDIKCMVERKIEGRRIPIHYMFRKADKKSFMELHKELREVQRKAKDRTKKDRKQKRTQKLIMSMPKFIRRLIWHFVMTNPFRNVKNLGIMGVSSVGKFGKGMTGYVIPKTMHQTQCLIGAIMKKIIPTENGHETRDVIGLTLTFNHDMIDGGPAVDFAKRLSELMKMAFEIPNV
jgi:pyruvate/2-oxoglutarate dehydrogenase complex dihydrolipoamide acyltransferase (E2) component